VDILVTPTASVTTVEVSGDIDSSSAPLAQQRILGLVNPSCRILLDMRRVEYMSSAGLRMLLSLYRSIASGGGMVAVVGLSDDIRETMSLTGFLNFFKLYETLEEGLAVLNQ